MGCPVCAADLARVPGAVQVALLRRWSGDPEDAPWNDRVHPAAVDGDDWQQRYVRGFCSVDHAREWLVAGHPTDDEWHVDGPYDGSDVGCVVAAVVVLLLVLLVLALAVIGAREALRVVF